MKRFLFIIPLLFAVYAQATVSTTTQRVQYNCDGTTTTYTYAFEILEDDDLIVTKEQSDDETTLVLNTDYTVTGAGSVSGGTVELDSGSVCASGYTLTILREIELTQESDYTDGEAFSAESLENDWDRAVLVNQDQEEKLDRSPRVAISSTLTGLEIPVAASRAIGWNADGDALTTYATSGSSSFDNLSGYDDIEAACAATTTGDQLYIDTSGTVSTNTTCAATLVYGEGTLAVASGITLTLNGGIQCPPNHQAFDVSGGGTVAGTPTVSEISMNWWGTDADAMNAAAAFLRQAVNVGNTTYILSIDHGTYTFDESINFTDIRARFIVNGNNSYITSTSVGKIAFDFANSRYWNIQNFRLDGDSSDTPNVGVFVGRDDSGEVAGSGVIENVQLGGKWAKSAFYNYGAETETCRACKFVNTNQDAGTYAAVWTKQNVLSITSDFATIPTDSVSTSNHYLSDVEIANDGATSSLYIDGASQFMMDGYVKGSGTAGILIDVDAGMQLMRFWVTMNNYSTTVMDDAVAIVNSTGSSQTISSSEFYIKPPTNYNDWHYDVDGNIEFRGVTFRHLVDGDFDPTTNTLFFYNCDIQMYSSVSGADFSNVNQFYGNIVRVAEFADITFPSDIQDTIVISKGDGTRHYYNNRQSPTLADDAFTWDGQHKIIAIIGEGGGATDDDLSTINGTAYDGDEIVIHPYSTGATITVKHNVGNILLDGAADQDLVNSTSIGAGEKPSIRLLYSERSSKWIQQ